MSPLLNLGGRRKRTISQVLSNFLSRTREGKEIIWQFGKDRESASAAIVEYIDKHLKDQPEFQRQLSEALAEKERERFSTVVTEGGHVDQIINAGVVQRLEIRYVLFQDSKQVVTFLVGLVLIGAGYWWSIQPHWMSGDFNIAVAQFPQLGDPEPKVAEIISNNVFRFLDDQAKLITFENVQVSHRNIGVITNAEEAKDLASRINAQVVIYGDVTALGGQASLTPQFYIAEAFRADAGELNGQQKLAAPINLPLSDLLDPNSEPLKLIQERTLVMTEFTKALVHLALNDLPLAQESIETAVRHGKSQGPFEGQEVLYLFDSHIARLLGNRARAQKDIDEALQLNPNYGRAFIARAHIYYDEGDLAHAIEYYSRAKLLPDQPYGAFIPEKADFGIGNCCWVQLQNVKQNPEADSRAVNELEECVLDHYEQVVESYNRQKNAGKNLTEITAWAYYGIGTVLQARVQEKDARDSYQKALRLTTDEDLIQRILPLLNEVTP